MFVCSDILVLRMSTREAIVRGQYLQLFHLIEPGDEITTRNLTYVLLYYLIDEKKDTFYIFNLRLFVLIYWLNECLGNCPRTIYCNYFIREYGTLFFKFEFSIINKFYLGSFMWWKITSNLYRIQTRCLLWEPIVEVINYG